MLTQADYVNAFFSHDEYIDFFAEADASLEDVRKFSSAGTKIPIDDNCHG